MAELAKSAVLLTERQIGPSRITSATYQSVPIDQDISVRATMPKDQRENPLVRHEVGLELFDDESGTWIAMGSAVYAGGVYVDRQGKPQEHAGGVSIRIDHLPGRRWRGYIDRPDHGVTTDMGLDLWLGTRLVVKGGGPRDDVT